MLFFFFSSRRRHTRCSRDWSSDVCSSDLIFQDISEMVREKLHIKEFVQVCCGDEGSPKEAQRRRNCVNTLHYRLTQSRRRCASFGEPSSPQHTCTNSLMCSFSRTISDMSWKMSEM